MAGRSEYGKEQFARQLSLVVGLSRDPPGGSSASSMTAGSADSGQAEVGYVTEAGGGKLRKKELGRTIKFSPDTKRSSVLFPTTALADVGLGTASRGDSHGMGGPDTQDNTWIPDHVVNDQEPRHGDSCCAAGGESIEHVSPDTEQQLRMNGVGGGKLV